MLKQSRVEYVCTQRNLCQFLEKLINFVLRENPSKLATSKREIQSNIKKTVRTDHQK